MSVDKMEISRDMFADIAKIAEKEISATHIVIYPENVSKVWDYQPFPKYTDAQAFTAELAISDTPCRIVNLVTLKIL